MPQDEKPAGAGRGRQQAGTAKAAVTCLVAPYTTADTPQVQARQRAGWAEAALPHAPMPRQREQPDLPSALPPREAEATAASAFFCRLAEEFTPVPGRTWEQTRRYRHADLPGLSDGELWQEAERARSLLAWLPRTHYCRPWLEGRINAVAAEEQRRIEEVKNAAP